MSTWVLAGSGLALVLALLTWRSSRLRGRQRVAVVMSLGALAALGLGCGSYLFWLAHRWQPAPLHEVWFVGVQYERLVISSPRPVVAHLVRIDLQAPGLEVVVTPPARSSAGEVRAATTSSFAAAERVQLAINASYFYPFRSNHPFDYEPHEADPVHVLGLTASRGDVYGNSRAGLATAFFSPTQQLSFRPAGKPWNAVTGMGFVLQDGALAVFTEDAFTSVPYPRCLLGLDASARYLRLLVVDGKQAGYSEGLTLREAAELLRAHGGHTALQLDGGGSATLVRQAAGGGIERVNTPANFRVPGWERAVATHLGFRARALE